MSENKKIYINLAMLKNGKGNIECKQCYKK